MDRERFLSRFVHARQIKTVRDFPLKEAGKPAAVLIPIIEHKKELTVLFTQRAKHLKHHPGQVSFPGGKQEESDDDLQHTALRETEEEIGISSDLIDVVGSLPKYRTISRYEVTPYISFVSPQFTLRLDENEVDNVFEVPLAHLLDESQHLIHWVKRGGERHPVYFIQWLDKTIWGATAAFVRQLSDHLNQRT